MKEILLLEVMMRNMQEAARKVVILNTGGTIAMLVDDDTDAVKPERFIHCIQLSRYSSSTGR